MLLQTLKGFRDFLPTEVKKRNFIINIIKQVCERYGFDQLETPSLEYEEILLGKYGEEGDKLLYRFTDNGARKVALRYDQTVPTARVVAQYQHVLPNPFKRFQIQPVWRAENTQKGRYREFIQSDFDIFGSASPLADIDIIMTTLAVYKSLGFTKLKLLINDRAIFDGLPLGAIIAIDKLKKIGEDGVYTELVTKKIAKDIPEAKNILQSILTKEQPKNLQIIMELLKNTDINEEVIQFTPHLARGLDYYTGSIFEIESDDYPSGSLAGGGRYDNLIGMFINQTIPAVGVAIGFDRTYEAMEALKLFPQSLTFAYAKVLVTIFEPAFSKQSLEISRFLRNNNVNTELYLGSITNKNSLEKQLKYADQKHIPYCIIIGPEEMEKGMITLRNMSTRQQKSIYKGDIFREIT